MTPLIKFLSSPVRLGTATIVAATALAVPQAHADIFSLCGCFDASNFAVLYEGNGGKTLNFNNSTVSGVLGFPGNVGIGGTGQFAGSSGTINGNLEFAGAVNTNNSGPFTVTGTTTGGNANVQTDLNALNSLSQQLGLLSGTATTISSGGSVNASSGTSHTVNGVNAQVFTVTSVSFPNGTFTITGTSSQEVVFNVPFSPSGFNGSIVLAGGLTADDVIINLTPPPSPLAAYNTAYANLTGGPTLTISTNGLTTTADFLDPTGDFSINHSVLDGRIFSGDTQNSAIVSGANINSPGPTAPPIPEPASLALLGSGLVAFGIFRRRYRPAAR